jgi:DNA polymerase alpha subunit B
MDVGKKVPDVNAMGAQKISPYVARSNALSDRIESSFESHNGCLQSVFNAELEFEGDSNGQGISEVEILNKKCQSTYMMNTLSRRVGYLEQRIVSMEEGIEKMHDCKVHSIASACQDMALFCGRICCDTEGSRLNPQSVILEGSIATSKGARVRLDLSSCSEYRIFPGQIVAVRGKNPTGFCIVAEQMLSTLPFTVDRSATTKAFSMVVASGPFTAADNLMYEPLKALIQYCEREKPEVLLLLGPFVDEDHPDIGRGLIDVTFEDIFDVKIMGQLEALHQNTDTKVILLPSVRDVHHDVAFPQGPLSVPDHPKTLGISNPSTIRYERHL